MVSRPFHLQLLLTLTIGVAMVGTAGISISAARADVFVLISGGKIQGTLVQREMPTVNYTIDVESGGQLTIDRRQIKEVIRQRPTEVEYEQLAPTRQDTVEDHWAMAEWCRKNSLTRQREQHLRRIIELDDTVVQAWRALGYAQIGGRWVAKGEVPRENGMEFYKGRWRLQQEIQLLEEQAERNQAEKDWHAKLKRIRTAILFGDRTQAAQSELLAIRDPQAVGPLLQFLADEPMRPLSLLYVETLIRMKSPAARDALVNTSLAHRDVEVFHVCLDELARVKTPAMIEFYVRALRHADNGRVNRAAYVLARLGDETAIGPLIDALVTTHTVVTPARGNADTITASFGSVTDGAGKTSPTSPGFSRGQGPTIEPVRLKNQEALNALAKLTGDASFGYDQDAWKNWLAVRKLGLPKVQTRRESN